MKVLRDPPVLAFFSVKWENQRPYFVRICPLHCTVRFFLYRANVCQSSWDLDRQSIGLHVACTRR